MVDPLLRLLVAIVQDPAGIPHVSQAGRKRCRQTGTIIDLAQQHHATIPGDLGSVEVEANRQLWVETEGQL